MSPEVRDLTIYTPNPTEVAGLAGEGELVEGHLRTDLDARQDEVLKLLDELSEEIEAVIREFLPAGADDGSTWLGPPTGGCQSRPAGAA